MGKKKTGLITDEVRELINEVARETASMAYIDGMGGEVNYFRAMESLLFNYKKLAALVADYEAYTHVELQGRSASISSYSPSSGYTYRTEEDILDEMKWDIKQNSSIAWLDAHIVEGATAEITLEDFRHSYAVGGIDLSQTTDLTAATVIVERGGKLYAFTQFFMPANRVERATAIDGVPYDIFVKKGVVTLSGENYVDYKDVYNWFVMLKEKYEIYVLKVGYDRYSAQYLIDDMAAYGFHMDDVFQGENLAGVIREFEGILLDGNFKIPDNSLLKSHFLNVALKHNMETRKFRPVKIEQRARIDGFVSVIDAMTVRQKYYNEIGVMLKNAG